MSSLPNALTLLRLAAAPALALVFLVLPRPAADIAALALFVGAAATDWIDGRLARAWGVTSRFGAAMDPIADKAMVLIALAVLLSFGSGGPALVLPAALIIFREVFVSGLREYLGPGTGSLSVTGLAKWKTTVQMVAIVVLFVQGVAAGVLAARLAAGKTGVMGWDAAFVWSGRLGAGLLWFAAALTLVTGWDYYRKARPYLTERP